RRVSQRLLAHSQVADEAPIFLLLVLAFDDAQQIRWMNRYGDPHAVFLKDAPANGCDRHGAVEQAARGGGSERDDELRFDQRALEIVPPSAALDLIGIRPLVQPAFSALLELEMLHRIGDEYLRAIEPRIHECAVEHATGRSDEWLAGEVLVVARLLADEHQWRRGRSFAGDDLGGVAIKRTPGTLRFRFAKLAQRSDLGTIRLEQTHRHLASVGATLDQTRNSRSMFLMKC